jgi:capsular polysaccharide transport system permease protein
MFQDIKPFRRRADASTDEFETSRFRGSPVRRLKARHWLFLVSVVLPTLAAAIYYMFFATDIYSSESKFVVRAPDRAAATGLGLILRSAGFSNSGDELYAAQSIASSRDALRVLNRNGEFERAYTRPGISIFDRYDPFGNHRSFENLYRYFQKKVGVDIDNSTSITTLSVSAYAPQDAYRFNQQLLEMSEAMVNHLNERGRQDLVRYAQAEVDSSKAKSQAAAIALARFRTRSGVVDPDKQATAEMEMISKLQDSLIAAKTELAQLHHYAPDNPRVPVLKTQIGTIQGEIDREIGEVTGDRRSLATNAVEYQRLTLENDFAGKQLAAALGALEDARSETARKQAYIERITQPNLPDSSSEPRRLRGIIATLIIGLVAYGILLMLLAGVREHAQ